MFDTFCYDDIPTQHTHSYKQNHANPLFMPLLCYVLYAIHIHILIVFALACIVFVRFRQASEMNPIRNGEGNKRERRRERERQSVYSNNSVNRAEKGGIARREPCKFNRGGFCLCVVFRLPNKSNEPNQIRRTWREQNVSVHEGGKAISHRENKQPRNLFAGLASVLNWHMFVYTGLSRDDDFWFYSIRK